MFLNKCCWDCEHVCKLSFFTLCLLHMAKCLWWFPFCQNFRNVFGVETYQCAHAEKTRYETGDFDKNRYNFYITIKEEGPNNGSTWPEGNSPYKNSLLNSLKMKDISTDIPWTICCGTRVPPTDVWLFKLQTACKCTSSVMHLLKRQSSTSLTFVVLTLLVLLVSAAKS